MRPLLIMVVLSLSACDTAQIEPDAGGNECTDYTRRMPPSAFVGGSTLAGDFDLIRVVQPPNYIALKHEWEGDPDSVVHAPMLDATPKNGLTYLLGYTFVGEGFFEISVTETESATGEITALTSTESDGFGQAREDFESPMLLRQSSIYTIEARIKDEESAFRGGWVDLRICYPVVL
jgi:hypothetical protein